MNMHTKNFHLNFNKHSIYDILSMYFKLLIIINFYDKVAAVKNTLSFSDSLLRFFENNHGA